jgi:hypothetical protein
MKRHTTARTISLGCILLAASACAPSNMATDTCWTNENITGNLFSPPGFLFSCALRTTAQHTLDELEPTTAEPTVVRWDATYAPLPTPSDTPTQPEPAIIPQ